MCCVAVAVFGTIFAMRAVSLRRSLEQVQRNLAQYDIASAQIALQDASAYTEDIEYMLALISFLSHIPYVGDTYTASVQVVRLVHEGCLIAYDALDVAYSLTNAIDRARTGSSLTFLEDPRPYADFSAAERRAALNAFAQSATTLRSLRVALTLFAQDLERVHKEDLRIPQAISIINQAQERIPDIVTTIDTLAPFASLARAFGGLDEEAQFLVLYLNNAELRPGGGFIGAYSLVNIQEGEITGFVTEDSYTTDILVEGNDAYFVAPPAPIKDYLGIPEWYFRDASWSASFAQTAQDARQLLRQELAFGGQPIPDAPYIVGITPDFIEELLKLLGPVSANGTIYTSQNVYELLQYQVEQGFVDEGIAYAERKTALKVLAETVVDRLLSLSPSSWISFFGIFQDELAKKHVAIASVESDVEAFLEDADWAGTFAPESVDDTLLFVDANLGALKTDSVVDRVIVYQVEPTSSGQFLATTSITYTNNGVADYKTGQYRTYAQIFVPLGATLLETSGSEREVFANNSLGMTSFGTFIEVELGEEKNLTFTYLLPDTVTRAIQRGVYTLGVFKQIGSGDNLLTLDLNFGTNLVAADPEEDSENYGNMQYEYTTVLSSDELFRITL